MLDSEKSSSLDIEELVDDFIVNEKFVENKKDNQRQKKISNEKIDSRNNDLKSNFNKLNIVNNNIAEEYYNNKGKIGGLSFKLKSKPSISV